MTEPPKRVLSLTGTSTPTAYHFRVDEPLGGWAICTVNDQTGELTVQSDFTDACGHRWSANPKHLGAPTLTHFIADRPDGYNDYLVGKLLLGTGRQERFSPERTVKVMREAISARRRDGGVGRRTAYLDRAMARVIWMELEDLLGYDDLREFVEHIPQSYLDHVDPAPEFESMLMEPTSEYRVLHDLIIPALVKACQAEVARREAITTRCKPCTCDNSLGSSVPCRGVANLGSGWYCQRTREQGAAAAPFADEGGP